MTDLIERLRADLPRIDGYNGPYVDEDYVHDLLGEAADELDRLRAVLARTEANRDAAMQDAAEEYERAERLRAENERLRYEIGRLEARGVELAAALQETDR